MNFSRKSAGYFCFVFLIAALGFSSCRHEIQFDETRDVRVVIAEMLDRAGDMHNAQKYLEDALALDKNNADAKKYLEGLDARRNKSWECLSDMKTQMEVGSQKKRPRVYFHSGICLELQNKDDEALKSYDSAILASDKFEGFYIRRGLLLERTNRLEAALTDLNKAVELKDKYYMGNLHRGMFHLRRGNISAAQGEAEFLSKKNPAYSRTIKEAITLLEKNGK